MSFALPPVDSELREAFQMEDLIAIHRGQYVPPVLAEAKALAREAFERFKGAAIKPKALIYFVLRGDDNIELISIGPRGGWKRLWRFGQFKFQPKAIQAAN